MPASEQRGRWIRVSRLVAALKIEKTSEGYVLHVGRWLATGHWAALAVAAVLVVVFAVSLAKFPLFGPTATVDEQLAYYTVARNFVRFGYLNSFFLHDMSTSSDPAHHPFIYNHMPPGPEIFVSLVMRVVGERFWAVRLVLGVVFLVGLAYYVRFAGLVLRALGLEGPGYTLLLLSPWPVLHAMDHPAYSAFPFFAFFPLVALDAFERTGRTRHLAAALAVAFLASLYVTVHNFVIITVAWVLAVVLGLVRIRGRHVAALMAAAALGVAVQFLRMVVALGPTVFLQDVLYTVSNRMFGVPDPETLMAFYREHDLVLHGTHSFRPYDLLRTLNGALRWPGRFLTVVMGAAAVAWAVLRISRLQREKGALVIPTGPVLASVWGFVRLGLWIFAVAAVPILLFPAYSVDYDLQGLTGFFNAIAGVAILGYALRQVFEEGRVLWRMRGIGMVGRLGAWAAVVLLLGIALGATVLTQRENWRTIRAELVAELPSASVLELEEHVGGKVVMTNVYPHTAGFFTREAVFGGCEFPAVLPEDGVKPSACHTAWIRGYGRTADVRPTHFVLFRALFTGFTRCKGECLERLYDHLEARYQKLYENDLFAVFALRS